MNNRMLNIVVVSVSLSTMAMTAALGAVCWWAVEKWSPPPLNFSEIGSAIAVCICGLIDLCRWFRGADFWWMADTPKMRLYNRLLYAVCAACMAGLSIALVRPDIAAVIASALPFVRNREDTIFGLMMAFVLVCLANETRYHRHRHESKRGFLVTMDTAPAPQRVP